MSERERISSQVDYLSPPLKPPLKSSQRQLIYLGIILWILVSVLSILLYRLLSEDSKELVIFYVLIQIFFLAFINLVYVINVRIEQDRKIRTERTFSYIERWNNRFLDSRSSIAEIINIYRSDNSQSPVEIQRIIDQDNDIKVNMISLLNLLEEMSLAIIKGLVDEKIMHQYFIEIFILYYKAFSIFIESNRSQRSVRLYSSFKQVVERWSHYSGNY